MSELNKVAILILDGWGYSTNHENSAINPENTPNYYRVIGNQNIPTVLLRTDGEFVGLPNEQFGSSEIGHRNLAALILNALINGGAPGYAARAINNDDFTNSKTFQSILKHYDENPGGTIHVQSIISDGGIHSSYHLTAKLIERLATARPDAPIAIHAYADGRDTPIDSSHAHFSNFLELISHYPNARIETVAGRHLLERNNTKWHKTGQSQALEQGKAEYKNQVFTKFVDHAALLEYLQESNESGHQDQDIPSLCREGYGGMREGDIYVGAHFRNDRQKQSFMAHAGMIDADGTIDLKDGNLLPPITGIKVVSLIDSGVVGVSYLVEVPELECNVARLVAALGGTQLRLTEQAKSSHTGYFFSGCNDDNGLLEGETRTTLTSKGEEADHPEMNAREIAEKAKEEAGNYDLMVINIANADMIGHLGNDEQTRIATKIVDETLPDLITKLQELGYTIILTADHGNAEVQRDERGMPFTQHTFSPVTASVITPEVLVDWSAEAVDPMFDVKSVTTPLCAVGLTAARSATAGISPDQIPEEFRDALRNGDSLDIRLIYAASAAARNLSNSGPHR